MNRFHVHLNVADLDASVRFYSALFAAEPTVLKPDYAKWMLDDPKVNFAISNTGRMPGVDHLGFQVETDADLGTLGNRLEAAGAAIVPERAATCCYARSDKLWAEDPQGTRWESFRTVGDATTYYAADAARSANGACCAPDAAPASSGGEPAASCCGPGSGCC